MIKSMTSVCLEPFLFLIATTGINVISGFKSTKAKEGVTKGAKNRSDSKNVGGDLRKRN